MNGIESESKRMGYVARDLTHLAKELRNVADKAELAVADEFWPLPKYREILFANI